MGSVPDVLHHKITVKDKFLILASDGVWDYMSGQEAVNIVGAALDRGVKEEEVSKVLVLTALRTAAKDCGLTLEQLQSLPEGRQRRSRHDDTTAVVIYLNRDSN